MKVLILILFLGYTLTGAFGTCCCESYSAREQAVKGCCSDKMGPKLSFEASHSELTGSERGTDEKSAPSCTKICCQNLFLGTSLSLEKPLNHGMNLAAKVRVPVPIYKDALTPPPRA